MDSPTIIPEAQTLTPSSSGRRRISFDSCSPEFEFWMVRNPSYPEPNLHSADELFVDGFLLPLHLLSHHHHHHQRDPPPEPEPPNSDPHVPDPEPPPPPEPEPEPGPGPKITAESTAPLSASKRWRDIFKKGDKKNAKAEQEEYKEKDKEKKKERKSGAGSGSAAELNININIWPFSRSRSAGNACTRPKTMFGAPGSRKVNSAPCSRSNSAGESKSRKWPTSPGRAGVHLGRSSPVWQVRRGGSAGGGAGRSVEPLVRNAEKGAKKNAPESRRSKPTATVSAAGDGGGGPAKAKVLNINVPVCIGYRNHLSCRSDENSALSVGTSDGTTGGGGGKIRSGGAGGGGSGGGGRGGGVGSVGNGGNLFNLRSLFTKKVY